MVDFLLQNLLQSCRNKVGYQLNIV